MAGHRRAGGMAFFPFTIKPEWWAEYQANERNAKAVLKKCAAGLAEKLGMGADALNDALQKIQWKYQCLMRDTDGIGDASRAKTNLRRLAKKAGELEALMLALGQGATEVMQRRTVRLDLIADADPDGLPDPDTHPSARLFRNPDTDEWEADLGRWVTRLRALAELARVKADRIQKQTAKGGKRSFAARLRGESVEEGLARACKDFAQARGCQSQAVVLKMVRAVLEAEHGKKAMLDIDGNPAKQVGRKAFAKVFHALTPARTV